MDSVVHYSKVYHCSWWDRVTDNAILIKLYYIGILFILWIDTLVRGFLLVLFVRVSVIIIPFVLVAYIVFVIFIWITSFGKSIDAPAKHFTLTMKETGLICLYHIHSIHNRQN